MPIYVYEVVTEDDSPGQRYEIMQPMTADALTKHPETGTCMSDGTIRSRVNTEAFQKLAFRLQDPSGSQPGSQCNVPKP